MTRDFSFQNPEFDHYAADYDAALAQGISVSGESKEYFARGRVAWLAGCVRRLREQPRHVMDFGCGTGTATAYLLDLTDGGSVLGVDTSTESLKVARGAFGSQAAQFLPLNQFQPDGRFDLAFCSGVFHHIPLDERAAAVDYIYRSLRGGGVFAFWENNPWNPGTRYVMSRIPFDRDAITLSHREARRLLRQGGFDVIRTDFLFIFPRALSRFRNLEPLVSRLPFGAQYQILCRKP